MQPKNGKPKKVKDPTIRPKREVCLVIITDNMLDRAEERFAELEKNFSWSPGRLKAKKAETLAIIIRSRGVRLTSHQVTIAQKEFKREISKRRRRRTLAERQEQLEIDDAIAHEQRRREDTDDQGMDEPGQNRIASLQQFYETDQAMRDAERACKARNDDLIRDP